MELTNIEEAQYLDQKANEFITSGENSFKGLAIAVYLIEKNEYWRALGYDSFPDYYVGHLGREKSTISRLKTAGEVLVSAGYTLDSLPAGNFSYKRIADIKKIHPEMEPKLLIASAETWTQDDVKAEKKSECKTPEYIQVCKHCWATPEKHA